MDREELIDNYLEKIRSELESYNLDEVIFLTDNF